MENQQTQIAVLNAKVDSMESVIDRMEVSIGKITTMNEKMGELLAVHAEKLQTQDKVDDILFDKFEGFRKEVKDEFGLVREGCKRDIMLVKDRLQEVEKRVFLATGALVVISFFAKPVVEVYAQTLFSPAKSATIERVVDASNESGSGRIYQPTVSETR